MEKFILKIGIFSYLYFYPTIILISVVNFTNMSENNKLDEFIKELKRRYSTLGHASTLIREVRDFMLDNDLTEKELDIINYSFINDTTIGTDIKDTVLSDIFLYQPLDSNSEVFRKLLDYFKKECKNDNNSLVSTILLCGNFRYNKARESIMCLVREFLEYDARGIYLWSEPIYGIDHISPKVVKKTMYSIDTVRFFLEGKDRDSISSRIFIPYDAIINMTVYNPILDNSGKPTNHSSVDIIYRESEQQILNDTFLIWRGV